MSEENKNNIVQDDEIDLVELLRSIWEKRLSIIKTAGVFFLIGISVAILSPVEYRASCKLLPESDQSQTASDMAGLAGLAGLAGVDISSLSGGNSTLPPQLYPDVIFSTPFIAELASDTIFFQKENINTTSLYYLYDIATPTLVGYPMRIWRKLLGKHDSSVYRLPSRELKFKNYSKDQWKLLEKFRHRIEILFEEETGLISISVKMPDPLAAATLANLIELEVTKKVTEYKTGKAKFNLEYIEEVYDDAKRNFDELQIRYAKTVDRNRNVTSETGQIELRNVENEYNLAFEMYKGLAGQMAQAKLQLKEQTPVFTILEPVRIPEEKDSPKRILITIGFTLIGGIVSIGILTTGYLMKNLIQGLKK